jgi:hypothetical protein
MILNQRFDSYEIQEHDPVSGVLDTIAKQRQENSGVKAVIDPLEVSGATGSQFSNSHSVSLYLPEIAAASAPHQTILRVLHADLPNNVTLRIGREAAHSADQTAPGPFTDVFIAFPPADIIDISANQGNPIIPFDIFHNTTDKFAGVIKMQLWKQGVDVTDVYDYVDDEGNAGYVIIQLLTPYTTGDISGRAAETIAEGSGSGQTRLLLRPYDTDLPFYQIGCLQNEISKAFQEEFAEIEKGFKQNILTEFIRKQLTDFEAVATAQGTKLHAILNNGVIQDWTYGSKVVASESGELRRYEALLLSSSTQGKHCICRLPIATVKKNGNQDTGGNEPNIPFTVHSHVPAEELLTQDVYDSATYLVPIKVGA